MARPKTGRPPKKSLNLTVDEQTRERLDQISKAKEMSISAMVEEWSAKIEYHTKSDLMKVHERDREECREQIKKMESGLLFAELDDTIQFDICNIDNNTWTLHMGREKAVYNAIIHELKDRIHRYERELGIEE